MAIYLVFLHGEVIDAISFVLQGEGHALGQGHKSFQSSCSRPLLIAQFKTYLQYPRTYSVSPERCTPAP